MVTLDYGMLFKLRHAITTAVTISCLLSACHARSVDPKIEEQFSKSHAKALELWAAYSRDVESALQGVQYNDSLENASRFFRDVSGIEIRFEHSYVGALPTEETRSDWDRVRAWFEGHKARLFWSEAAQRVRVKGAPV